MSKTALIIDCDPGVDDAIALLLAFACPDELDVLAVTTVGGNVGAALTARNARLIRQIAGREEVPVYAGAEAPLVRPPIAASHFHGESGLGFMRVFEPAAPIAPGTSAQAIVDLVTSRPPGSVRMAVMGPMTNLALALRLEPALAERLGTVVVMGGARREGGNITASAEYNIYADPHAAEIVLGSGASVVMLGLDATHQVRMTPERVAPLRGIDTPQAKAVCELLDFCQHTQATLVGPGYSPVHDPCTIAWLLRSELFETVAADIRVETNSELTLGHTAVEFRLKDPAASRLRWATGADGDGVFALMTERLCG